MEKTSRSLNPPWYRPQILWLVIGIPAATVLGCLLTIYLALSNPDYRVHDATATGNAAEQDQ